MLGGCLIASYLEGCPVLPFLLLHAMWSLFLNKFILFNGGLNWNATMLVCIHGFLFVLQLHLDTNMKACTIAELV